MGGVLTYANTAGISNRELKAKAARAATTAATRAYTCISNRELKVRLFACPAYTGQSAHLK